MKKSQELLLLNKIINKNFNSQSLFFVRSGFAIFILFSPILFLSNLFAENLLNQSVETKQMSTMDDHSHWNYLGVAGPNHWGLISDEYILCETGSRQSPINISMTYHEDQQQKLDFDYRTSELHVVNNGHTVQVSHVSGCHVTLNDQKYDLRQFHLHAPSEHQIAGKTFPMEMHLVHQNDSGHVLVVAVMMEVTDIQPVLDKLWKWLPDQIGQEVPIPLEVSLSETLPKNTEHFTYSGSLTTPPCTEGIQWVVLKDPMHVAQQDIDRFIQIYGKNARPIQPVGERIIKDF